MSGNRFEPMPGSMGEVRELSKKPISVWLFQAVLALSAVAMTFGFLRITFDLLTEFNRIREPGHVVLEALWRLVAASVLAAIVYSIERRKKAGRVAGLLILAGVAIALFNQPKIEVPEEYRRTPSMEAGYALTGYLSWIPFAYWTFAFGLSDKAKRYFSSDQRQAAC